MRRYIIAANWKMNMDLVRGPDLVRGILSRTGAEGVAGQVEIVLCPPFILLEQTRRLLEGSGIALGAQNMHFMDDGAYTGEISAAMLLSAGCSTVILGHSERRTYFGETNEIINRKAQKALAAGLRPIVCIGETLQERESNRTFEIIERQVRGVLAGLTAQQMQNVVVAYEPVWAIGTGRNATAQQAQEVHGFIRGLVASLFSPIISGALQIQYGGSMKAENAMEILAQSDVDGGLIGGASLHAEQFTAIVAAAETLTRSAS